jgi:hypothetical protein
MFASLQSLGSTPVSKEHCSIVFSIGARCIAHSFSIQFGILSGPKPFWKYVKSKHQESGGIAPLKKGTNLISDSKGKAELLLNQFKSFFTKPTNNNLPSTGSR